MIKQNKEKKKTKDGEVSAQKSAESQTTDPDIGSICQIYDEKWGETVRNVNAGTYQKLMTLTNFGTIEELEIEEELSEPYTIKGKCFFWEEIYGDVVGMEPKVTLATEGKTRYWHGVITEWIEGGTDLKDERYYYEFEMRPKLWYRMQSRQNKIHVSDKGMRVKELASKLIEDAMQNNKNTKVKFEQKYDVNFAKVKSAQNNPNGPLIEYAVQYEETTYEFFQRLLSNHGIFYYYKHAKDGSKIIFKDNTSKMEPITGIRKIEIGDNDKVEANYDNLFLSKQGSDEINSPFVDTWGKVNRYAIGKQKARGRNYEKAGIEVEFDKLGKVEEKKHEGNAEEGFENNEYFETLTDPDAAEDHAKHITDSSESVKTQYKSVTSNFLISPGYLFELKSALDLYQHTKVYKTEKKSKIKKIKSDVKAASKRDLPDQVKEVIDNKYYARKTKHKLFLKNPEMAEESLTDPLYKQQNIKSKAGQVSGFEYSYVNESIFLKENTVFKVLPKVKRQILGYQSAIVVGPDNAEINTDDLGRVKIKFNWDNDDTLSYSERSCWVRVAQWGGSGAGFGGSYIPRVGQEVIVTYENGNPDNPIVIGTVFNSINSNPYDLPDDSHKTGLRTKTIDDEKEDFGFNEITISDKAEEEQIYIHAQKDLLTEIENDKILLVKQGDIDTQVNNGNIEISTLAEDDEKQGDYKITLEKGSKEISLLSKGDEKSHHKIEISKGDLIEKITEGNISNEIEKGNLDMKLASGNLSTTLEKGDLSISLSSGDFKSDIKGNKSISIKSGDYTISISGGAIKISADGINMESSKSVEISSNANISLKSSGQVSIEGKAGVSIKGAKLDLKADTIANIKGSMVKIN